VRFLGSGRADPRSRRGRLQGPERSGIRRPARRHQTYSNWPTIPQLYVKGEFVGGCDIIREMFQAGELQQLFADKGVTVSAAASA